LEIATRPALDKSVRLSAAPQVFDGRAFVPLRSLAELFGYEVNWVAASRTVAIASAGSTPRNFADHRTALNQSGPLGVEVDFHDATPSEIPVLLDAAKNAGAGLIKTRFRLAHSGAAKRRRLPVACVRPRGARGAQSRPGRGGSAGRLGAVGLHLLTIE
jgi:hypothetical protein